MGYLFAKLALLCFVSSWFSARLAQSSSFNVVDYGAVGDGKTDDTQAFLKAWADVCEAEDGTPTLEIPAEKIFLLHNIIFQGPCKSSSVIVSLSGNIIAPDMLAWTGDKTSWIGFRNINGLNVIGEGQIDGQGASWWKCASPANVRAPCTTNSIEGCQRPTAVHFVGCNGLQINGIKSVNSPAIHISITSCDDSTVSNVHLTAPGDSPNTDGIDISQSTNVNIQDSYISTGDDCVAIGSPSSFINITNVACGPGHGISIGSLGRDGQTAQVEEIHVKRCNFTRTTNGCRIKTFPKGSGYARKISFDHIFLEDVMNPIIIDQNYCAGCGCGQGQASNIHVSDITYRRFRGSAINTPAITLDCSKTTPCTNIVVDHVMIVNKDGGDSEAVCSNAQGRESRTTPSLKCLA